MRSHDRIASIAVDISFGARLEGYLLPQVAGESGSMATTFINANRTLPSGERISSTDQLTHVVTMTEPSAFRYYSCCL